MNSPFSERIIELPYRIQEQIPQHKNMKGGVILAREAQQRSCEKLRAMQKAEGEYAMCLLHERNIKRFPNSCNSNVECYIESERANITAKSEVGKSRWTNVLPDH